MKGVWLENNKLSYRDDLQKPIPPNGEVLVQVIRSGICNTDIELEKGYYPYTGVLGHEFVGIVVDENAPSNIKGLRVAGEINCSCHNCKFCFSGMERHCPKRTVMGIVNRWGAHAEYVSLPVKNLKLVPKNISSRYLCFIEPLAAALEIQEQIKVNASDRVAVIGDGKLGLLVSKTMKLTNSHLRVYGHHKEKLAILEKDGIETKLTIAEEDYHTFDIVVECSGNKTALQQAVDLLRPRGILVLKSTHEGDTEVNMAPIVVNELTLIGSRCGPFEKAISYLNKGLIDLDGILHKEYPIEQAMEAFEYAKQKDVLKVQLVMLNDQ